MFIKKLLAVATVACMMTNLMGCSSGSTETATTTTKADTSGGTVATAAKTEEPVEIRVAWFGNQSRHDLLNTICDNFEAANPNITVVREFAATTDYWRKITTQMAGKSAPDVFVCQYDRFENFVDKGQLLQLDDLMAAGTLDLSNFSQGHLNNGKVGNGTYGVSLGGSVRLFILNKDMIAEAGLEYPDSGWTWEEFEQYCYDLKAYYTDPDVYALEDFTISSDVLQAYVRSHGYDYFTDGALGFPEEIYTEYLEMAQRLRDAGCIPQPEIQIEFGNKSQPESMLAKNQVVMQWKPSNQLPLYQEVMEDQLDLQVFPGTDGTISTSGSFIGSTNWVVPAYTEHPEAACAFINYFSNEEEAVDLWQIELGPLPNDVMAAYINPSLDASNQRVVEFCTEVLPELRSIAGLPENGSEALAAVLPFCEKVSYGSLTIEQAVEEYFASATLTLNN